MKRTRLRFDQAFHVRSLLYLSNYNHFIVNTTHTYHIRSFMYQSLITRRNAPYTNLFPVTVYKLHWSFMGWSLSEWKECEPCIRYDLPLLSFLCPVISNYPKTGLPRDPRMTSMFRRGTIFATFFLSLLGGGLVCAALVTQHWVEARPLRTPNPQESAGKVHFGLLQGKKELNVAYGWRTYHISGKFLYSVEIKITRYLSHPFDKLLTLLGKTLQLMGSISYVPDLRTFSISGYHGFPSLLLSFFPISLPAAVVMPRIKQ